MTVSFINIANVTPGQFEVWFNQMSLKKQQLISEIKVEQKQKLGIAADALCRKAISEFCGISDYEIRFERSPLGKPYAKNLPVKFSISHSGDYAVCAVDDNEIGIDIEKIRTVHPRAHEKFCTESEAEYVRTAENGLFKIWTLKEAYFKCIGTGLGADIKNVSFRIENGKIECSEKGFKCSFYPIKEGYCCSICEKINGAD